MRTFNIAIVGAGPAGYFSVLALQHLETEVVNYKIDLYERLPTPYGLVRSGVAPDHPKIKSVSKVFENISDHERFELLANIEVGSDVSLQDLTTHYDAVVIATGTPNGKKLGILGEGLNNCFSSAEFVSWYNGHPDFCDLAVDLSGERAIVIGAGNVALDIARLLTMNPSDLDSTDISIKALNTLHSSNLREVLIVSRRGPESVSFTAPELRELEKMESFNIEVVAEDLLLTRSQLSNEVRRDQLAKIEFFEAISERYKKPNVRTLKFLFNQKPIRVDGDTHVKTITLSKGSEEYEIDVDLMVTAIGYEIAPLFDLPVNGQHFQNKDGWVSGNLFTVGWAKRGPSGVIGTNKSDAADVMKKLATFLQAKDPKLELPTPPRLQGLEVVTLKGWRNIDASEVLNGQSKGKSRSKFLRISEMLSVAKG